MKFSRVWAMPNADTFSIPEIEGFVKRYLMQAKVSIDPFARNKRWTTYTNDLNPETAADSHVEALDFLATLAQQEVKADVILFDPPYSARQVSECYANVGRKATMQDTQGKSWSDWKTAIVPVCATNAIVLSFGWNSVGMGNKHGFEQIEIMLCCHGGVHNDTICLAERRITPEPSLF